MCRANACPAGKLPLIYSCVCVCVCVRVCADTVYFFFTRSCFLLNVAGSFHCSNGKCINSAFKCDKQDDCGDFSDEIDCASNCQFYMASSGDVVESPNYPHKYMSLSNCKWTLEGPQGHNILLQVYEPRSNFPSKLI
jgi:hypothetical protein